MKIYIKNHSFHYELENLTRIFFPNEKIITEQYADVMQKPYIFTSEDAGNLYVRFCTDGFDDSARCAAAEDEKENERLMAILLYGILEKYTGVVQPWGILTGVRPIKLMRRLAESLGEQGAAEYFEKSLLVTPEKTELAKRTQRLEKQLIDLSQKNSFSLYISIPFCPSRCSYCSFVPQSVEKAKHLMQPYTELLCKEIEYTASIAEKLGLRLETVYVGGGTPTALSDAQLTAVLNAVKNSFDLSSCREFTVEAGRPDTVTEEKLRIIRESGAKRISINPQTMNDSVLQAIGRKHTARQTVEAFMLARQAGFKHINTDLIAGLPTDTAESFKNTLNQICTLNPESITVHTLSMKKSSFLTGQGLNLMKKDAQTVGEMLSFCEEKLNSLSYRPYYLYRQSRMVGNFENVGWAKKGFEGLYNVYVMDETHTVLGCGAGAVTKLKQYGGEYLERIFNYKYPYEYNDGFSEMLNRKEAIEKFYAKYF